ncbi:hypothetical protein WOLCODRAFT_63530, partial [Wolfiporia cocos MD-104 SS10]
ARKSKPNCVITSSHFHPHVPAEQHISEWQTPHSKNFHQLSLSILSPDHSIHLVNVLLSALEPKTCQLYGAGLLHFTQYCNSLNIPELLCMPAPELLIASFIAEWSGQVAWSTVDNWLASLHFWHTLNGAPWNGGDLVHTVSQVSIATPADLRCERHPPVMLEHLHALQSGLDLTNAFNATTYACICMAFWCICRLREVVIPSPGQFDAKYHAHRDALLCFCRLPGGSEYTTLHILWTKTTQSDGANVIILSIDDPTNPILAICHHLSANQHVPSDAPFFAFETSDGGWAPLTCGWFLDRCNEVRTSASLCSVTSHSFCIGGTTELLLHGTPLGIVAVQGRWKSRAFMEYWCCIEQVLPLFIISSTHCSHVDSIKTCMNTYRKCCNP